MRTYNTIVVGLALLAGLAQAVGDSKGAELFFLYQAYRLDREASLASRPAGSTDPRPWSLGFKCEPIEEDFKPGTTYDGTKGCNIHGFIRAFSSNGYSVKQREVGFTKVTDAWNPTLEQLFEIGTWGGPAPNGDKFIYAKLDLKGVMGRAVPATWYYPVIDKNTGITENKPGDIYEFENVLRTVGYIATHHANLQPNIAKPYVRNMVIATKWAEAGRRKEEAQLMIDDFKKQVAAVSPSGGSGYVKTKPSKMLWSPNIMGTWDEIDVKASLNAMGIPIQEKQKVAKLCKDYVQEYRKDGQEASHARIIQQHDRLFNTLLKFIGIDDKPACDNTCPLCGQAA